MINPRATSPLPTKHGLFQATVFENTTTGAEHIALVRGDTTGDDILVRVHSECLTGEALGSLKCDCRAQLEAALATIGREGGVVIYLKQHEGRGIGLANKIKAYALQARGADTVDANRLLGLPDDARTYDDAAEILALLGAKSIRLITNNPLKVASLRRCGVTINHREPSIVKLPSALAKAYLQTKRDRMSHRLPSHIGAQP